MTLKLTLPSAEGDLKPRITVFGVGGAGGNAVDNMISKDLPGVDFVVGNTDAQALAQARAPHKVQMGVKVTEGLGAGAKPEVGAAAAEESIEGIIDHLAGAHMCFITAGMGGGTGTGAAPIIAHAARELGVLTIGVVTKPFTFEGTRRMRQAEEGIEALQRVVDTLIIIPNQNLFRLATPETTFADAFGMADDVLYQGVKGVTDLMVRPGLINLDFADVRSVMDEMGKAMMGTGEASREDTQDRARAAAEMAITNPLLDGMSLKGAQGVLINVTGGPDMTLFELDEAANVIRDQVDPDANIIVGSCLDPEMAGRIRVSVVATGIDAAEAEMATPLPRRDAAARAARQAPTAEPAPAPIEAPAAMAEPEPESEVVPFGAPVVRAVEPEPVEEDEDGLPPPAYRPAPRPAVAAPAAFAAAPETFVAPRARAAGEPSAEVLARLREVAAKGGPRATPGPERTAPAAPARRPGLGSLLGRMTGTGEPGAAPHGGDDFVEEAPQDERIEIPAFLRRQAN